MGSLSNFAENALLNHVCNNTGSWTPVATVYVALCTADPTDAGTAAAMNEVVAGATGYTRMPVTFGAPLNRKVIQNAPVTFPQATASYPAPVTYWAIVSSVSGAGDMYAYGNFESGFTPVNGNTPTIPTNEIEVEIGRTHYTNTTISAVTPNILNDSANNFPLFTPGQLLYISGFTGTPANNTTTGFTVSTSSASQIVFTGSPLVNDASGESVRISSSGGFTNYLVHNWLNRMFRNQTFVKPNTFVALATVDIDDDDDATGQVTEVLTTGGTLYARVQVFPNATGGPPNWTVASGTAGALENSGLITFPTPGASWGSVTAMFLVDSGPAGGTVGNILGYDNWSFLAQTPILGDTVQFPSGGLDLVMT